MSCDLNQAHNCADCMVVPSASCCCDGTMGASGAAASWQTAQLQQQIDELNAKLQRQREEAMREALQDAADLNMYHAGVTEVVDVRPVESSRERRP